MGEYPFDGESILNKNKNKNGTPHFGFGGWVATVL